MFFRLLLNLRSINQKSFGFRNIQENLKNALMRGNKITQDSREKKLNEMPQGFSGIPYSHVGLNKHVSRCGTFSKVRLKITLKWG